VTERVSWLRRIGGWAVHAFTASGLICGAGVALLLLQSERSPDTYRYCFLLFLLACVIDGVDGTLARWVRIKQAVPSFDGRRLDDLVDFVMYTCLPLLLLYRAGILPADYNWVLLVALLSSAYGFCQVGIKSHDGAFVGFPSYWNIAAYYLYCWPAEGWLAVTIILVLSFLTFVPSRYPYPTQPGPINRLMLVLSIVWGFFLLFDLSRSWIGREPPRWELVASTIYPVLYMGVAWGQSIDRVIRGERMFGDDEPGTLSPES
jgi:phosphatidylcholine synthase